jgi:hypothetical protein
MEEEIIEEEVMDKEEIEDKIVRGGRGMGLGKATFKVKDTVAWDLGA